MNTLTLMPAYEVRSLYPDRVRLAQRLAEQGVPTRVIARRTGWHPRSVERALSRLWKNDTRKPVDIPPVDSERMMAWTVQRVHFEAMPTDDGRHVVRRLDRPGEVRFSDTSFGVFSVADEWVNEQQHERE